MKFFICYIYIYINNINKLTKMLIEEKEVVEDFLSSV
jgi:hypothetical protein